MTPDTSLLTMATYLVGDAQPELPTQGTVYAGVVPGVITGGEAVTYGSEE